MKKISTKILSVILALVMILAVVPLNSTAAEKFLGAFPKDELKFGVMSDLHFYPKELTGDYCDTFMFNSNAALGREMYQSQAILDSALAAYEKHAKENGLKYLIIAGDLTSNGEYQAHVELSKRLVKFEKDTGIQVIAINGNHDIVKPDATTYESGEKKESRKLYANEFLELYKDLGYDIAYHKYTPPEGKEANMLSYSVVDGKTRFIVMDTGIYSPDVTKSGEYGGETAGGMSDEFLSWVLDEISEAKANGETVIGVSHHNFMYHFRGEYRVLRGFVINNFEELGETLADAGMHYNFSGHIHQNDIAQVVSDSGETLTEICCPSLSSYPNYFREASVKTAANGDITVDVKSFDVDCEKPVEVNGDKYSSPFIYDSFGLTFVGKDGFANKASELILSLLKDYGPKIEKDGIVGLLKGMGVDLEEILTGFLGDGIKLGKADIFTAKNILNFADDLSNQIYEAYLADPEATADFLEAEINEILKVKVSDLPCDRFVDTYGFGSKTKAGDLEDLLCCVLVYMYQGDVYVEDDPFVMDAVEQLKNGDTAFELFDVLVKVLVDDIVQSKVLSDIELRLESLYPNGTLGHMLLSLLAAFAKIIFHNDTSLLNLANTVLNTAYNLSIVDFGSVWGILEYFMDLYLTDSQLQGIGQTLAGLVLDFAEDDSIKEDSDATLTYTGPVEVEATRENYRLPTAVTVTFGENQSSRNISWYTKPSVTGTDIEILEETNGTFTGKNLVPAGVTVSAQTVKTTRQYPGVDLGIIGVMNYEFTMSRHIINVSNLEAGKKYIYRVGDAAKNWWSQTGSFTIADGGDETSFVHIGDPQSQSAQQYDTFAELIRKAYEIYDSDFIIDTGDNVDHGDNFRQWQWLLDEASDTLMNTVLMSASGNHEDMGTNAIDKNFVYSNIPEQDVSTGIYCSFDYNNIHFAILNTNDLDDDDSLSDTQINWLKEDMNNSTADWKFVALHKAIYSNGSHYKDGDVRKIRNELCKLMPQLGIDMVFQGHDHVYLRTDSMVNNWVEKVDTTKTTFNGKEYEVKQSPIGTVYVISGCSGVKVYNQKDASLTDKYFPRAEAIYDVDDSVFSGVHIVGDTLYFDAYTVDVKTGETENIDSFAIQKNLGAEKQGKAVPALGSMLMNIVRFMASVIQSMLQFITRLTNFCPAGLIK
ncbi:MAG: metallophosphoesterase [Clostridia bacterium]|nr:metallophosphoesterase [Clostridia bacterium]